MADNTTTDAAEARALPVIQADRDAAASLVPLCFGTSNFWRSNVRAGYYDDGEIVQAFARHRLATAEAASGAGEREWPDIGEDPMKARPYDDRMAVSAAALRKAYTVQQPIVPDQTALVWRWHLGALLEAEIRLRSILADDDEPASLPPATDPAMVEVRALASRLAERQKLMWMAPDKDGGVHQLVDASDLADAVTALAALAAAPTIPATGHAATEGEGA